MGGQVLMEAIMDVSAVPREANKRKRHREAARGDIMVLPNLRHQV